MHVAILSDSGTSSPHMVAKGSYFQNCLDHEEEARSYPTCRCYEANKWVNFGRLIYFAIKAS